MRAAAILAVAMAGCATVPPSPIDLTRFQTDRPEFGLTRGPDGWYLSRMNAAFGTDASSTMWRYPFDGSLPRPATFSDPGANERDFSWDSVSRTGCFVRESDIWCANWSDAGGWSNLGAPALPHQQHRL